MHTIVSYRIDRRPIAGCCHLVNLIALSQFSCGSFPGVLLFYKKSPLNIDTKQPKQMSAARMANTDKPAPPWAWLAQHCCGAHVRGRPQRCCSSQASARSVRVSGDGRRNERTDRQKEIAIALWRGLRPNNTSPAAVIRKNYESEYATN